MSMSYGEVEVHQLMLQDRIRTEAYRQAIEQALQGGERVIDFGCGTGILSFFAARAGAAQVDAIDRSPFIQLARRIAIDNGLEQIAFYYGEGAEVTLPAQADVLVSEWMGHFAFWEWMLDPLISIRERYLKPGGRMIPGRISLRSALVTDAGLHEQWRYFASQPYDLDFSAISAWQFDTVHRAKLSREQVAPDIAEFADLDLHTIEATPRRIDASFTPSQPLTAYALCGWFVAELIEGVEIDTGPLADRTHWAQLLFPFGEALSVEPGVPVEVSIWLIHEDKKEQTAWRWRIKAGDRVIDRNTLVTRVAVSAKPPPGPLD